VKNFFVEIIKACRSDDILNLSASISFFAILSLLPLTMIFVAALGLIIGSDESITHIAAIITDVVPGAEAIIKSNITNLVDSRSSIGFWGIGFLLVVSTVLFGSLERAFNKIFESEKRRNFFHSRLLAVGVIFIILLLLFLPSTIQFLEITLAKYGYLIPLSSYLTAKVFFVFFAMFSYLVTIVIVPNQKVYLRYALVGAVFYAAGIAVAKYLFRWYLVASFDRYNLIYGSLTAMILTVIWIYYLSNILLISAELVAHLQRRGNVDGRK
jgi:membrane protein